MNYRSTCETKLIIMKKLKLFIFAVIMGLFALASEGYNSAIGQERQDQEERQDLERQDFDRQDQERQDLERQDRERQDLERQDRERQDLERQDRERQGPERQDQDGEHPEQEDLFAIDGLPQSVRDALMEEYEDWVPVQATIETDEAEGTFYKVLITKEDEGEAKMVKINREGEVIDEQEAEMPEPDDVQGAGEGDSNEGRK
jgi:hypothetical protein